jgi:chromosome partitioning protein
VMEQLRAERGNVLQTAIPASAHIERMGAERTVLAQFAPRGPAAAAYEELWAEVKDELPTA